MKVYCCKDDCKYIKDNFCESEIICINDDGNCDDFESYLEEKEWQTPYWKRMLDKDNNKVCRVQYRGKKFEINGRTFFVDYKSDYAIVTDFLTGLSCGEVCRLDNKRVDAIIHAAQKVEPPLEDLPIAIYDEKTRKFSYERVEE